MGDALQWFDVGIIPDADVIARNASTSFDSSCFDNNQPIATGSPPTIMHQMPVVGETITGTVLAHRRDTDAIAKCHSTYGQWIK